jgi:hypothetical protein
MGNYLKFSGTSLVELNHLPLYIFGLVFTPSDYEFSYEKKKLSN